MEAARTLADIRISTSKGHAMTIIKVGSDKYINVDRMTYVVPKRHGRLVVHFDVGGGDVAGPSCCMTLDEDEAAVFRGWLDDQSKG